MGWQLCVQVGSGVQDFVALSRSPFFPAHPHPRPTPPLGVLLKHPPRPLSGRALIRATMGTRPRHVS